MKIQLEVPEIECCRCHTTAPIMPAALKRGQGVDAIVDSAGGSWVMAGLPMPSGWTEPTPGKKLCPPCSKAYADGVSQLLQPVVREPVPAELAPLPPGAQRMVQARPNAGRVTAGPIVHHAPPASRPAMSIAPPTAAPVRPAVANPSPMRPAAPQPAAQPNRVAAVPPTVRTIPLPAERNDGVVVHGRSHYPSTEAVKADPIPANQARAELEPLSNEEIEPQQPPATRAI